MCYHVFNRSNNRMKLFKKDADFQTFYGVLFQAHERFGLAILGWCVMEDHWHFVVKPKKEGDLSRFFGYIGVTHAARWHSDHNSIGSGHIYQGRFKSFMIQENQHLLSVLRFVESNPLRTKDVRKAEKYPWSSLHACLQGPAELKAILADWPVDRPRNWVAQVNQPQSKPELDLITLSLKRSRPLGDPDWVNKTAQRLGLMSTIRPRGRRPGWRKETDGKRKKPGTQSAK
jgi:putative transposase